MARKTLVPSPLDAISGIERERGPLSHELKQMFHRVLTSDRAKTEEWHRRCARIILNSMDD